MTDGEAVRRALQGDAAALSELARSWAARVLAFCRARCGNLHVAEDIAQEALLRALKNLSSLESPERFGPWLRGIAIRVHLDWLKAGQTSQVPFSMLGSDEGLDDLLARDDEAVAERNDDVRRLQSEIETLDEDHRETLMLYYSNNMTYAELAALLGVSSATVNLRLTTARAILRTRLASMRDGQEVTGAKRSQPRSPTETKLTAERR